jgi:hypothetical protein
MTRNRTAGVESALADRFRASAKAALMMHMSGKVCELQGVKRARRASRLLRPSVRRLIGREDFY